MAAELTFFDQILRTTFTSSSYVIRKFKYLRERTEFLAVAPAPVAGQDCGVPVTQVFALTPSNATQLEE